MKIQFSFLSLTLIIVSLFVPSCFSKVALSKKEVTSSQSPPTTGSTNPQSSDSSCSIENPTNIASKVDVSQVTTKDESSYFHSSLVKLFDGNSAIGVQDVLWLIVAPASLTMLFTWVVKKGFSDMTSKKISKLNRISYFTLAYVVVLYVRTYFASLSVTATTATTESSEEDKQDSLAQTEMSLPSFLFFFIHFLPALKADGTLTSIFHLLLSALIGTTTVLTLFKIAVLSDILYFNYLFLYLVVGLFFYTFSFKSAASRWFGLVVTWTHCSFSYSMVLLDALLVLYQLSKSSFVLPSESKDKIEKQKDLIPTLVIAFVFAFVLFAKRFSSLPHIVLNVARAILFLYSPSQ